MRTSNHTRATRAAHWRIVDGNGTELAVVLAEANENAVAQRAAHQLGVPVYLRSTHAAVGGACFQPGAWIVALRCDIEETVIAWADTHGLAIAQAARLLLLPPAEIAALCNGAEVHYDGLLVVIAPEAGCVSAEHREDLRPGVPCPLAN